MLRLTHASVVRRIAEIASISQLSAHPVLTQAQSKHIYIVVAV